jgi:hypothetical protein
MPARLLGDRLSTPLDYEKFRKFCGMLGSDHDGERAAAAAMANKMLAAAGMKWEDVINPAAGVGMGVSATAYDGRFHNARAAAEDILRRQQDIRNEAMRASRPASYGNDMNDAPAKNMYGWPADRLIAAVANGLAARPPLSPVLREFMAGLEKLAERLGERTTLTREQWQRLVFCADAAGVDVDR